jgi:hypothetical protein
LRDEELKRDISGGVAFPGEPFLTINVLLCPVVEETIHGGSELIE